ncbi:MAG: TonB-dependent receptor [Desulfuromonadaceae bacterium]|nr:TonB-dependent receptor [Desulfuromonadaceae bacterium]
MGTVFLGALLLATQSVGAMPVAQEVEDVVVTATRTSTSLDQVGGTSVSVITAAQIEARHLTSVSEVLKTIPGLEISNTGGMGSASKVFIRGADSKNTLLLIDGVMANDPTDINRGADFSNITLDNVERIEVVKGPMSVLYGSNATAGVINIITRSGAAATRTHVGMEAGTYNTRKVYGGVDGSAAAVDFSLSASQLTSGGYSLANADNNDIPHAGNTSEEDGWENTTIGAKLTAQLCPAATLTAVVRYVDAQMELDDWGSGYAGDRFDYSFISWSYQPNPAGSLDNRLETQRLFGRLNLHSVLADGIVVSDLDYKYSRQERDAYDNDDNDFYDYLGTTDEWSWQTSWQIVSSHTLTAGIGYFRESSDSRSAAKQDAETSSLWLQDQWRLAGFDVVAGMRYDHHDRFGGKASWRLAPAYRFAATGTTLRAACATGFRTPSLFELYSLYGDTDLDPEKSCSWEAGVDQELLDGRLQCGVTWFYTEYEDRIDWDSTRVIPASPWPGGYAQLDGESTSQGVEVATRLELDSAEVVLDYTYTHAVEPDDSRVARRPLNRVHLGLRYVVGAVTLNADGFWYDERKAITSARDASGQVVEDLDDYFLVNLAVHYDLNDWARLYGRIDNLFDEHYEEAWSYATPGQSFYAGVKLTF